jgi:GNAT superfamily N-acetyltransferase
MMITAPHIQLLVAQLDGELIGSGYARIEDAKPYLIHTSNMHTWVLCTHPEHRGKGINRKIIEALKEWSVSKGITELCVGCISTKMLQRSRHMRKLDL